MDPLERPLPKPGRRGAARVGAHLAIVFVLAGGAPALARIPPADGAGADPPLLVVLTESGADREGLPVLAPHPDGAKIAAELDRGVAGDLVRVYRLLQTRRQRLSGEAIEPAYLLLSSRQGGFARYGFWLGETRKEGVAFVDVHREWRRTGEFGAIDQIFPHELAHAMLHWLGVEPPEVSGANQVHAVAVRTDRFVAFDEGLAEHFQIMAVEHPDAAPKTRALAGALESDRAARRRLEEFRSEMLARWAPASRMRIAFLLWYSNDERVLRHFAVKRNEFAREVRIPDRLLGGRGRARAYLLESTLPGDEDGAIKPLAQLLATEGVVSAFFERWANDAELRGTRRDAGFYAQYGAAAEALPPLQNLYLKLLHAVGERRASDVPRLVAAYRELFPDEAEALDAAVAEIFGVARLAPPPEIWLANPEFTTGTTVFDQFGGLPRAHTFDLNAASIVDLVSVPGIDPGLARALRQGAPYDSIEAISRVPGAGPELVSRLRAMSAGMADLAKADEESLAMKGILLPYLWRLVAVLVAAAAAGALLGGLARRRWGIRPTRARAVLGGLAAALVGVPASWLAGSGLAAVAAVVLLFGLPAAFARAYRTRRAGPALAALAVWAITAAPAALLTIPWF